jgi:hypothetical protein
LIAARPTKTPQEHTATTPHTTKAKKKKKMVASNTQTYVFQPFARTE